jgi:hypothetical protein
MRTSLQSKEVGVGADGRLGADARGVLLAALAGLSEV